MEDSKSPYQHKRKNVYYNMGRFWVSEGEYQKAIQMFLEAKKDGVLQSNIDLGFIYIRGLGVKKNNSLAFELFEEAKDAGSMCPNFLNGLKNFYGFDRDIDYKKALDLFNRSNEVRDAEIHYLKSICCQELNETEKALRYLRIAAIKKHGLANLALGILYVEGKKIERDYGKAVKCLKIAYYQKLDKAKLYLALCYQYGCGIKKSMEKGFEILNGLPYLERSQATIELSLCYYLGLGVSQNKHLAQKIFSENIRNKIEICFNIAWDYIKGLKFPRDERKVIALLELSILSGYPEACYRLGLCYAKYFVEHKNQKKAEELFLRVLEFCDLKKLKHIARIYESGILVDQNNGILTKIYRRATFEFGDTDAAYKLGECYEYGRGLPVDHETATILFHLAAAKGSEKAKTKINYFSFSETLYNYNLAQRFENEFNDFKNAIHHYEVAALRGHKRSQRKLKSFSNDINL